MDERELRRDLSRLIRGELTSLEVKRLVRREGFRTFSELCETRLPEDLGRIRIGTRDVLTRIDRYRRHATDLYELWFWADELYNISFNHRIAYEARAEELITSALSALSVVTNQRLFPNVAKTERALDYIRACLLRRRTLRLRNIFLRIYEDLEVVHLANKRGPDLDAAAGAAEPGAPADDDEGSRWADVVLLDHPYEPGSDIYADYNWMIAFTVTARSLYDEERAEEAALEANLDDGWVCPECERERRARERSEREGEAPSDTGVPNWSEAGEAEDEPEPLASPRVRPTPRPEGDEIDRLPALRRLVPNFAFERYKPRYFHDGDGIAEIVIESERIGRPEIAYATKLFCIANRIREAHLDGERVKTLVVRPGSGRRGAREP